MRRIGSLFFGALLFLSQPAFTSIDREQKRAEKKLIDCTSQQTSAEMCMACAIAMEAGNQSVTGKIAVGLVIMNRVFSPRFPNTVCGVVNQKRREGSIRHAFSFLDHDISEKIRSSRAAYLKPSRLKVYRKLAKIIISQHQRHQTIDPRNPGTCATFYATHEAAKRSRFFRKKLALVSDHEDHQFYRDQRDGCVAGTYQHGDSFENSQLASNEESFRSIQ